MFGWQTRKRGNGSTAFDDTTGQVSGTWVVGRPPLSQPGLLLYIMVDDAAVTVDKIVANGGAIVQAIGGDALRSPRAFAIQVETCWRLSGAHSAPAQ